MTRTLRILGLAFLVSWLAACGDADDRTAAPPVEAPSETAADAGAAPPSPAAPEAQAPDAPAAPAGSEGPVAVDAEIPAYGSRSGIAGNLSSIGSDTLNNLMTLWAEGFGNVYPGVRIQVEGKGSSTAPPALIAGTAQLGPMSRAMKPSEIDAFDERHGYPPTAVRVAIDALAVYVNRDNPLERLTLPEVDAIFSKNRTCGWSEPIRTWGELGLTGPLAGRPIRLYGRNSASGTYGYFKDVALCGGDFSDSVKEQPGSASVVQSVSGDPYGMGYSGIGYTTSGVRPVALAPDDGAPYYSTDPEHVYSGEYPLARFLYVYVNKPPDGELDALTLEFLRYVLSTQGQRIVVKDGYLPLTAPMVERERAKLE